MRLLTKRIRTIKTVVFLDGKRLDPSRVTAKDVFRARRIYRRNPTTVRPEWAAQIRRMYEERFPCRRLSLLTSRVTILPYPVR